MKSYYFVNLIDAENVRLQGNTFFVNLQGKAYKTVKVLSGIVSLSVHTFNPALRLHSYTSNGFSSDRKHPVLCLFNDIYQVTGSDWRYNHADTPIYNISETLKELEFSFTDGNSATMDLSTIRLECILELEE